MTDSDGLILSTPVTDIDEVTAAIRQELAYLIQQEIRLRADRSKLLR